MSSHHTGDEIVPEPTIVFDRTRTIAAPPEAIFPWLLQLGKRRAGWYLPGRLERTLIPPGRRAARAIEPRWQDLAVGERIPDYGGRDAELEVALLSPPSALVYSSERAGGTRFSWALLLEPEAGDGTSVHLRFRGGLRSTGWRLRVLEPLGDLFDRVTSELMLDGLAERVLAGP